MVSWHAANQGSLRDVTAAVGELYAIWVSRLLVILVIFHCFFELIAALRSPFVFSTA